MFEMERYTPPSKKYRSCTQLERGTLHFSYNGSLKACCRRDFIDMPEISTYSGQPLDLSVVIEKIDEIRKANNTDIKPVCAGCSHLVEQEWPVAEKYMFNQAIVLNHYTLCNHRCSYCDIHSAEKPLDITPILENIFSIGAMNPLAPVILGGGEPALLQGQLARIINLSKEHGNPISIATNSSIFSETIYDFLEHEQHPSSAIMTSLDAGTPELYKKKHGRDDFHTVLNNLSRYIKAAQKARVIIKYIFDIDNHKSECYIPFADAVEQLGAKIVFLHIERVQSKKGTRAVLAQARGNLRTHLLQRMPNLTVVLND